MARNPSGRRQPASASSGLPRMGGGAAPAAAVPPVRRAAGGVRPGYWLIAALVLGVTVLAILVRGGRSAGAPQPAAAPGAAGARPPFDKAAAFKDLEKQVAFGPRVPNSAGHAACRDWLVETLKPLADSVERQDLSVTLDQKPLRMSNIIARWKGTGTGPGVLLCAHWDTRPTADEDPDPARRAQPILGANDGASGVAVLLEAARAFKRQPPPVPVMLVLFDGEDVGPDIDRMFLGSRYFAENLPRDVPRRGILLDMVGDRDLQIPQELYSVQKARDLVLEVYATARKLGLERHFPGRGGAPIMDDHLPLHEKGLKVIDLIDFDYGPRHAWWHTHQDTPDKCSPDSLAAVGNVVLEWLYAQK